MPVVSVTGAFIGMVMAVETVTQFRAIGQENRIGSIINLSVLKQIGPVLAAVMLAGRIGGALTAELGTMNVTEQLDALRVMGSDPIRYLVVPRFVACVLLTPMLTIYSDLLGILGGWVISVFMLGIPNAPYWANSHVGDRQIMEGISKSFFFGAAIGLISCYKGFTSGSGASGVGKACTESFVASFIAIIVLNFVFAEMFKEMYLALYGVRGISDVSKLVPYTLPMPLIALRNLYKRFGKLLVLNHVNLEIAEGQSLVVIGASGSGKSVMLKHIVGLLKPDEGEVWVSGRRIDNLSERELQSVRQQFGFLFQMGALFDSMTVEENIAFPLIEHTTKSKEEIDKIVGQKLTMVGLPETRKKVPGQLSGGQRKRIALARAIALEPAVILYDEPTTGLDPIRADVINELILKLQRELKVTSIVVTHDMHSAFKVADRIVMLHQGNFIFDGTVPQIQYSADPIIQRFVRGEAGEEELASLNENGT